MKGRRNNRLKNTVELMLDWLIAPDTSTGLGCDNMSAIVVDLRTYTAEHSKK